VHEYVLRRCDLPIGSAVESDRRDSLVSTSSTRVESGGSALGTDSGSMGVYTLDRFAALGVLVSVFSDSLLRFPLAVAVAVFLPTAEAAFLQEKQLSACWRAGESSGLGNCGPGGEALPHFEWFQPTPGCSLQIGVHMAIISWESGGFRCILARLEGL